MNYRVLALLIGLTTLAACAEKPASVGATSGTGAAASASAGAVPGSQEDLVANVGDRVFFAFDQSDLSPDARATLDRQAAWLQRFPQIAIQIAGDCDERGTEEYNLALGQRRANAARDYLVAHGVSGSRIKTISYGKERPVAVGSDEQAYQQNRNAITSVL